MYQTLQLQHKQLLSLALTHTTAHTFVGWSIWWWWGKGLL